MTLESRVRARLNRKKKDPAYQAERLALAVTEEISRRMQEEGVTKAELARRLGVSKARITHLLNGSPNLTLRTIASVAVALGSEVDLRIRDWASSPESLLEDQGPSHQMIAE